MKCGNGTVFSVFIDACAFICGKWRKHHHCVRPVNLFVRRFRAILHFSIWQINCVTLIIIVLSTFSSSSLFASSLIRSVVRQRAEHNIMSFSVCVCRVECSLFPFLANYNYTIITFSDGESHTGFRQSVFFLLWRSRFFSFWSDGWPRLSIYYMVYNKWFKHKSTVIQCVCCTKFPNIVCASFAWAGRIFAIASCVRNARFQSTKFETIKQCQFQRSQQRIEAMQNGKITTHKRQRTTKYTK